MRLTVLLDAVFVTSAVQAGEVKSPNVVLILADDLGDGDVSCNNPAEEMNLISENAEVAERLKLTLSRWLSANE